MITALFSNQWRLNLTVVKTERQEEISEWGTSKPKSSGWVWNRGCIGEYAQKCVCWGLLCENFDALCVNMSTIQYYIFPKNCWFCGIGILVTQIEMNDIFPKIMTFFWNPITSCRVLILMPALHHRSIKWQLLVCLGLYSHALFISAACWV